ncbi:hypothetical protein EON65_36310 [archaeon]|nr:MAG: hypothetical protein EON65_36310 [archaeon]
MFYDTLACVYFILVANGAGSDERTIILRNRLSLVARLPYHFFLVWVRIPGASVSIYTCYLCPGTTVAGS